MSDSRQPRWVRPLLGRILPPDYRDDVALSLDQAAARRFDPATPRFVLHAWYLRQIASPSMAVLAMRVRRFEAGRQRPMGHNDGGRWPGGHGAQTAFRALRRRPLFAVSVVLSLALGIGANVAIFSASRAVLLRPPPYAEADRLVLVWNELSGFQDSRLPMLPYQIRELRGDSSVFDDVAGIWATARTVSMDERAMLARTGLITPNFFSVLGVQARLGRTFAEDEGMADATAIISDGMWRQQFGAAADVVGRSVMIDGQEATVVGVLPSGFRLTFPPDVGVPPDLDVFVPFPWVATSDPRGQRFLRAVARLNAGVEITQANEAVRRTSARLRATFVEMAQAGDEFRAVPLQADAVAFVRPVLMSLLGAVILFLLLTSSNVAGLVLAHASRRKRDMVVRAWLGATRRQLAGEVVAEIGTLALLGTALGLLLGHVGARVLWALRPPKLASLPELTLDSTVLTFAVLAGVAAALGASVVPLIRLSDTDAGPTHLRAPLEVGAVGAGRRWIIIAEFALCLVLVVGAGLMSRTVARLQSSDLGFDPRQVLTFRLGLSNRLFPADLERATLAQTVEDELRSLTGVTAVGANSHLPLGAWANWGAPATPPEVPVEERDRHFVDHRSVSVGYFEALGIDIVQGRTFRQDDGPDSRPVVVIDEELADRSFNGESAVGKTLVSTRYVGSDFVPTEALVVGVVRNVRDRGPDLPSQGQLFWPFAQSPRWELGFVLRTVEDQAVVADRVRERVREINPDLAVTDFRPMETLVRDATADARFVRSLATIFSILALVLAAFGVYGVVAASMDARTRELGLRIAMGAEGRHVFVRVLTEGLRLALSGVALGLLLAAGLTRFLRGILFGVDPLDPLVISGVAFFLMIVAMAAAAAPAYRASRLDPVRSIAA
jgi:putative ABC transport system permease protein